MLPCPIHHLSLAPASFLLSLPTPVLTLATICLVPSTTTCPIPASFRNHKTPAGSVTSSPLANVSQEPPGRKNHQGDQPARLGFDTRSTADVQTRAIFCTAWKQHIYLISGKMIFIFLPFIKPKFL